MIFPENATPEECAALVESYNRSRPKPKGPANRRRYIPYVGQTVEIRWNSGNDSHADEHIDRGLVVNAGPDTLWIDAEPQGVKPRQDVFIKYRDITLIREETT